MKKICYVTTIGITVKAFFASQLKFLAENGYDVSVICSHDRDLENMLDKRVHYIPVEIPRGISFFGSLRAIFQLKKIFKKEQFDLVQYSTPNAAFYAGVAAKSAGIKTRNYHLMGLRYLGEKGLLRIVLKALDKNACKNATHIECVSQSNLELGVQENLFEREKAVVVWNGSTGGVDTKRFDFSKREQWRSALRAELGYHPDDFIFGFVGRITRDKGINELLQAFFSLEGNSKLFFIGYMENEDGGLDEALWHRAQTDPRVLIHDKVEDIERYYAMIDVLMLPSYREGFGNVVIEAAAVGTPAIVSEIPGPTDAIEKDVTAFTVLPRDADGLANAMCKMRETADNAMGLAAYRFAKEHFDEKQLNIKIKERKDILLRQEK